MVAMNNLVKNFQKASSALEITRRPVKDNFMIWSHFTFFFWRASQEQGALNWPRDNR